MGQITQTHCQKCGMDTDQEWQVDREDPYELIFFKLCHRCGGFNYD